MSQKLSLQTGIYRLKMGSEHASFFFQNHSFFVKIRSALVLVARPVLGPLNVCIRPA